MEPQPETSQEDWDSSPSPAASFFLGIIGTLRIIAIVGSIAFIAVGAVLACEFFYFVQDIVVRPEGVVQGWQGMVQSRHGDPKPSPDMPNGAGNASFGDAPIPIPPPSSAPQGTLAEPPPGLPEAEGPPDARRETARPGSRPRESVEAADPWLALGIAVLDRIEAGELGWFASLIVLVAFCWILGKVPVAIIATGGKVLVDLFKVGDSP